MQVAGSMPSIWELYVKLLALGFSLTHFKLLQAYKKVNQWVGTFFFSLLSLCLSTSINLNVVFPTLGFSGNVLGILFFFH